MTTDYIEYLRESANTKVEVCFGEQSIKRKKQLYDYYRDKLISNQDPGPGNQGPGPGNSNNQGYISRIYDSFYTLMSYLKISKN
jgi:hypothetical protein